MSCKVKKAPIPIAIAGIILVVAVIILIAGYLLSSPQREPTIITQSSLKKIIQVSELSTFTAVYNGIALVPNEEKPEKTDFYVAYDANVDVGIDFEKVDVFVDNKEKVVRISVPDVYITNVEVDISSLDYMFINDKANTTTVSHRAFKACEADAEQETENQESIIQLGEQNAKNVLQALVKPIIEQVDAEFVLTIE